MSLLANFVLLGASVLPSAAPGTTDGRATKPAPSRPDPRVAALLEQLAPPPGPFHRTRILQTILWPEQVILDRTLGSYLRQRELTRAIRALMDGMERNQKAGIPRPN